MNTTFLPSAYPARPSGIDLSLLLPANAKHFINAYSDTTHPRTYLGWHRLCDVPMYG
jgi:hypothetical protein